MADGVLEALVVFVIGAGVGLACPDWRILWLLPALTAIWAVGAAIDGGEDHDGAAIWWWALFFGIVATVVGSMGMVIGIVCGRWLRDRTS